MSYLHKTGKSFISLCRLSLVKLTFQREGCKVCKIKNEAQERKWLYNVIEEKYCKIHWFDYLSKNSHNLN